MRASAASANARPTFRVDGLGKLSFRLVASGEALPVDGLLVGSEPGLLRAGLVGSEDDRAAGLYHAPPTVRTGGQEGDDAARAAAWSSPSQAVPTSTSAAA